MSELAHTDKQQLIIGGIDAETLLRKIANGAYLKDLEAETGLDKRRLSEQLRKHPDYKAAKEASTECQLDEAFEMLKCAQDAVDIARAREQFKAAAWRAEREFPHRWGQKVEQLGGVQINVVIGDPLQTEKTVVNVPKCDATSGRIDSDAGESDASA